LNWLTGLLARDTSVWTDDVWVVDSTPVECARSRGTVRRSDLAGWAEYGYCASHSRFFWGLRLHLVATLHGLPIGFALTGAKADERQVLLDLFHDDPTLAGSRPGQLLIADKNYYGRDFEADLTGQGIRLLRRARKGEPERSGGTFFKPLRQTVESIFDTLKGQLDLAQRPHRPSRQTSTTGSWRRDRRGANETRTRSLRWMLTDDAALGWTRGDPWMTGLADIQPFRPGLVPVGRLLASYSLAYSCR